MPTPSNRRYRTAKKIQIAAVTLAIENGLSNITTEEISLAANVSPRTFFNYFPYKEAALVGPHVDYPKDAVDAFIVGQGSLIDDLQLLITQHVNRYKDERELLRNLIRLSENEPKLLALLNSYVLIRRESLNEILGQRLPDANPNMLHILSSAIIAATNDAIRQWALKKSSDLLQAAKDNLELILPAAELLRQD